MIHGDCLEFLPTLGPNSIGAIIIDPPFGIDFKYANYDDTSEGYGEWLWSCIEIAESKCVAGAPVFVWQAMPNVRKFIEWFPREWRLFAACKNWVQIRQTTMQYSYDPVVVWWTPGEVWSAGTLSRDFYIADTSPSSRVKLGDVVKGHPCPRPLAQVQHIIEQWVHPDSTVIDFFMGSGQTGVACIKTGRKFIGVEIDETYFRLAQERVAKALVEVGRVGELTEELACAMRMSTPLSLY